MHEGNHELIEGLWDLTEQGDPLLFRLYVDALRDEAIETDDVIKRSDQSRTPSVLGLDAYLSLWWEYQVKQWKRTVSLDGDALELTLSALACKLGPITRGELRKVLSETSSAKLNAVVDALARFLVPVAVQDQVGYSFSHPRLADFFRAKYVPADEVVEWHKRFVRAADKQRLALECGDIVSAQVLPYFLRHYGEHLKHAHADVEDLAALVSRPWLEAWRASPSFEWGFQREADLLATAATERDRLEIQSGGHAPFFHHETRAAFVKASLISLSTGLPPELLRTALSLGIRKYDRALVEVRQGPVALRRAISFCVLASDPASPDPNELLDSAAAIAATLSGQERDEAWKAVAEARIATGSGAEEAQREVSDGSWRKHFLIQHAVRIVRTTGDSLTLFEGLRPGEEFDVSLAFLEHASGTLRDALFSRAESLARAMSPDERGIALLRLVSVAPQRQSELVDAALDAAAEVAKWGMADEMCESIFNGLPEHINDAQLERAYTITHLVNERGRDATTVYAALVRLLPENERHAGRREILKAILDAEGGFLTAWIDLFGRWANDIHDNEVSARLHSFPLEPSFAPITLRLSDRVSNEVFATTVRQIVSTILLAEHSAATYLWSLVAPHVPPHRWAEVLDVLDQLIADEAFSPTKSIGWSAQGPLRSAMTMKEKRAAACRLLQEAVKHIDREALPKAVAFASSAPPTEKTMLLLSLLPRLDADTQLRALHQILEQWPRLWFREKELQLLQQHLPAGLPADLQARVVEIVQSERGENRSAIIARLAPKFGSGAVNRLLALARRIDDDYERIECVTTLALFGGPATAAHYVRALLSRRDLSRAIPLLDVVAPADLRDILEIHSRVQAPDPDASGAFLAAVASRVDAELLPTILERLEALPFDWHQLREHHYISTIALRMASTGLAPHAIEAIARWPEEDGRAHALVALASVSAPEQFEQLHAIALGLDNRHAKATAICGLVRLVPADLTLSDEILADREVGARVALRVLATEWHEAVDVDGLWPQAIDRIERIGFGRREDDRELIRGALRRASPERQAWTIDTVLRRCTEAKENQRFYFADLMCAMVEFCSATQYMELAGLGVEFTDVHDWARIAIELFGHGNAQQRADLLARCQPRRNPHHALITRVVAARHGSEPDRRDALRDIMSNRTSHEGWCLRYGVSALQLLEPPERYEHCARLLKQASGEGRRDTLERIRTLAPLIASFQTPAEVTSIIVAIEEVSEWWP